MAAMIQFLFMNNREPKREPKFRPNVAGILRNRDGKILICERIHVRNAWQFPQGGVDEGETLEEALARELWEEIGLDEKDFRIVQKRGGYRYHFPSGRKKGYEGKEQTYFLCDFLAEDKKIDLEAHVPEFRGWKWIAPKDFRRDWLPPMKLDVYSRVFRDFFGIEL
jgi:putative (di)nucleoside polyphosphate hydrolase